MLQLQQWILLFSLAVMSVQGQNTVCESSYDCPKYFYCDNFNAYPLNFLHNGPLVPMGKCVTQYQKLPENATIDCSSVASDGINLYPDHDKCKQWDMEEKNLNSIHESIMACFPEFGYTCAKSYLTPCLARYDRRGRQIPRRKRDCPIRGFVCGNAYYRSEQGTLTKYRTCELPLYSEFDHSTHYNSLCHNSLQCGFDNQRLEWNRCEESFCRASTLK